MCITNSITRSKLTSLERKKSRLYGTCHPIFDEFFQKLLYNICLVYIKHLKLICHSVLDNTIWGKADENIIEIHKVSVRFLLN